MIKPLKALRVRITFAMLCLTLVASSMFALMIFLAFEQLEHTVLRDLVNDEYELLRSSLAADATTKPARTALFRSYIGDDDPQLPPSFKSAATGNHHAFQVGDRFYEMLIGDTGKQRLYVAYDITEWEHLETPILTILALGVLLSSLLAIWLGYRASARIIAPVTAVSEWLTQMAPEQRGIRMAPEFAGSEVAPIAEAFDRYANRLDRFVEREQMFTAAASHELRTPLAVMSGALEILLETRDLPPPAQRASGRIGRAIREMQEFIDALLMLSREPAQDTADQGHCELGSIAAQLVNDQRSLLHARPIELTFSADNLLHLEVPPALPAIVLSNLLRNAVENTESGRIDVKLAGRQISIRDTGKGADEATMNLMFERGYSTKTTGGMGLFIVKRICDRFKWQIALDSVQGQGTVVTIDFAAGQKDAGQAG